MLLVLCYVLAGDWLVFVFVFLCLVDKKGKENVRKSRHVFVCLKFGFVFFSALVEDEHRSKLIYFLDFKFFFEFVKIDKLKKN